MGTLRLPPEPGPNARVTRISDRLVLVSVPITPVLKPHAAKLLTRAQESVVELTVNGLSNAAIARKRRCSPRTVANLLAAAYKKLGVGTRRELRAKFGR